MSNGANSRVVKETAVAKTSGEVFVDLIADVAVAVFTEWVSAGWAWCVHTAIGGGRRVSQSVSLACGRAVQVITGNSKATSFKSYL